jgi:uncharacterized protein YjbJ (UPF0337 family)
MSWDIIEGNWQNFKGKIKKEWGAFTDEHLDDIAGQRDQLSDKIQNFYGVSKDAADAQIDAFAQRNKDHKAA